MTGDDFIRKLGQTRQFYYFELILEEKMEDRGISMGQKWVDKAKKQPNGTKPS